MPTAIINGKKVVVPKGHEAVEIDGVMTIVSTAEASRLRKVSVAAGGAAVSRRDLRSNAEKYNDGELEKLAASREGCLFYRLSSFEGETGTVTYKLHGKDKHLPVRFSKDLLKKDGKHAAIADLKVGAAVAVRRESVSGWFDHFNGDTGMTEKVYSEHHSVDVVYCFIPEERVAEFGLSL